MSNIIADKDEETALERLDLISELLSDVLDPSSRSKLRSQIAFNTGISERTIYRYEKAYKEDGIKGLYPVPRKSSYSKRLPSNYDVILKEAIILRIEVPSRSVNEIIYILEHEGYAPIGSLKRPTLQRHLYNAGYGKVHMKKYTDPLRVTSTKRFCMPHRMMMVQADIKYGPGLIYTDNGKNKTAYLSTVIDDHSRFILSSIWFDKQDEGCVREVFRTAVLRYGKFDKSYVDNGKQYVAKQLKTTLSRLGIKLKHAPVRSGKSKGVIERFHQTVDQFIAEIRLERPKTLEEINEAWVSFYEEYYHNKPHEGIAEYYKSYDREVPPEGISPKKEWNKDSRHLQFFDVNTVAEAFRYHEKRKVDKDGLIQFKGERYEAGEAYEDQYVEISYDPGNIDDIKVIIKGREPFNIHKCGPIPKQCDYKPKKEVKDNRHEPKPSRLLNITRNEHKQSIEKTASAINFSEYAYGKEDKDNV